MYYDSRFFTLNDIWHNFYDVCNLVALATAVLHIRPVSLLSNPEENIDLFIFCLAICLGMILIIGRSVEVILVVEGEQAAKAASKRDAAMYAFMTIFFIAATVYAGVKYYGNNDSDNEYHYDYDNNSYGDASSAYNSTDGYYNQTMTEDGYHAQDDDHAHIRFLAGGYETEESYPDNNTNEYSGDIAVGLLLAGFGFNHLLWFFNLAYFLPWLSGGDFKR